MELDRPGPEMTETLTRLWESSVRATHHFLSEADIEALRPQVGEAFQGVSLLAAKDEEGRIVGFAGISGDRLEMLFVSGDHLRQGLGRALLKEVLARGVRRLEVNEQNPGALAFYVAEGFEVIRRSATDEQGRPFPLLYMRRV